MLKGAIYLKSCTVCQAFKLVQGVLYAVAIPEGRRQLVGRDEQQSTKMLWVMSHKCL